jgi:hypothetical protein
LVPNCLNCFNNLVLGVQKPIFRIKFVLNPSPNNKEIAALVENNTWELVKPPPNQPVIPCKWIYRIKRNEDGSNLKYKSRLCACGNHQTEGVDYDSIYSAVARQESFRIFLAIAADRKMFSGKMDCVAAFLNGFLQKAVYMKHQATSTSLFPHTFSN